MTDVFEWKARLLIEGCSMAPGLHFSEETALKKIHLYKHSNEKNDHPIPDDVLLDEETIVRIRYRSSAPFVLEEGYQIRDTRTGNTIPVQLVKGAKFRDRHVKEMPLSTICALLGNDLLGITPSNYCFYFGQKTQCRFCEILPTFKNDVEYPKTFKNIDVIEQSVLAALESEERLQYLALTTGNIISYDATFDYFIDIGRRLQKNSLFGRVKQNLATLMPPDDFHKIKELSMSGFNKIYFPLEVFERSHFEEICPGKTTYGYDKILDALDAAVDAFGPGNVYTNFVYGLQSPNYEPRKENEAALIAVQEMLKRSVIPAFTLYHYGGYNSIGDLQLNPEATIDFFREWGELVRHSKLATTENAVLFGPLSLSNTLFNDGYRTAKQAVWK